MPSTEFERSPAAPGIPASAASIGRVTSDSTSSVESPGASVWISTRGGANSGKASILTSRKLATPATIAIMARTTSALRWRRQRVISARINA